MTIELSQLIGSLVLAWFVGYGSGLTFRLVKNIVERASRP